MKDLAKHMLKLWALPWLITSPFIILGWPEWAYIAIFGVFHILLRLLDGKRERGRPHMREWKPLSGTIVGDKVLWSEGFTTKEITNPLIKDWPEGKERLITRDDFQCRCCQDVEMTITKHDGTVVELHPVESPPVNVPAPKHKGE